MPTMTKKANFDMIRNWLNEINTEKKAAAKSAAPMSEPTGRGSTSHPSKNVDDGLEKATTGSRASENSADIKKQQPAGNIDETGDSPGKSQEDLNYNIGLHQSSTGEDASTEDAYKSKHSDPGTSHPANLDEDVRKYGEYVKKEAGQLASLADEILADIFVQTGERPAQKTAAQASPADVNAGYTAAEQAANAPSQEAVAAQVIAETIKNAQRAGDMVGSFIVAEMKKAAQLNKRAADPTDSDMGEDGAPMPPGGGGELPPEALAAAMGGGEGGPPPGGEMPPEAAMGGGGAPGGPGGGGNEDALQELAMALIELGITPEQLAQIASQMGGAGGGGGGGEEMGGMMPPGGAEGMMPPPAAGGGEEMGGLPPGGPADVGAKIASAVIGYKKSGKFRVAEAKTAAQRSMRDEMKRYLMELTGNGRG